jgi:hypothetical protein
MAACDVFFPPRQLVLLVNSSLHSLVLPALTAILDIIQVLLVLQSACIAQQAPSIHSGEPLCARIVL